MSIYSIYKITNQVNKKVYIGYTHDADQRWSKHLSTAKTKTKPSYSAVHKAMNRYGIENFAFEVIYQSKDQDHTLNEMEPWFIAEHRSFGEHGYNLTKGGDVNPMEGQKHTEETRAKLSAAAKARTVHPRLGKYHSDESKAKMSAVKLGKPWSDETKAKMSATRTGMKHTEDTKAKQAAAAANRTDNKKKVLLDGVLYSSVSDAAKARSVSNKTITNWIKKDKASYA